MPRKLARKLILSITVIVLIVAAVSGLVNVTTAERQFLNTMLLGAGQLSNGITGATWHAMLDDRREEAYQVMQTAYNWPGNVRELENTMERAMVTCKNHVLTEDSFSFLGQNGIPGQTWAPPVGIVARTLLSAGSRRFSTRLP